ncbi:MAG: FAD-binding domain [Sphingomonadales bacterium]|nr:FAD-binding domain [Sphingomonadales bacterium]MBD3772203.1 FAD-binding domain [Paracoccaceae bacterium]
MRIAISGAGVAGPTLAYWLRRGGHEPFIVERAPQLRTGGYVIDFWGLGYDIAERMGIVETVLAKGYRVSEVRIVGDDGHRKSGFPVDALAGLTDGRFTSLPRGDLASAIFSTIRDEVEVIFGTTITALEDRGDAVTIALANGEMRTVDLVIGADGLHSNVRSLAFGPEAGFERDLGYAVAAFNIPGYAPRDEDVYVMRAWPGRSISRFALRDGSSLVLMVMAAEAMGGAIPADTVGKRAMLRQVYADMGWETSGILAAMDAQEDIYFDRVSQIELPHWTSGRVALVGDAAACASLLAGEGTGLGMTEAYVLAAALAGHDDYRRAFADYEARLRPFLADKQKSAREFAGAFAPKTRLGLAVRDMAARMLALPGAAQLLVGGNISDDFELPDFPAGSSSR